MYKIASKKDILSALRKMLQPPEAAGPSQYPEDPDVKSRVYDTSENKLKVWDGEKWVPVGA